MYWTPLITPFNLPDVKPLSHFVILQRQSLLADTPEFLIFPNTIESLIWHSHGLSRFLKNLIYSEVLPPKSY